VGAPARRTGPAVEDPFAMADDEYASIPEFLRGEEAQQMDHSDMERALAQRGRELTRKLYQAWLELKAQGEVSGPVIGVEGEERSQRREQERGLETQFGTVSVSRTAYVAPGEQSLRPLDADLNLPPERYSLEVRRLVAEEVSKNSFDEAVKAVRGVSGARVPKRQAEELVVRAAQDFDAFYEAKRYALETARPQTGSLLVLTSDGKGVVMHREDLRPATRKAARKKQNKLRTRLTKGEKRHRKRMATVAAIYTVVPYVRTPEQVIQMLRRTEPDDRTTRRPRPEEKRVWASLEKEPFEVLDHAFREGVERDPGEQKTWVAVVDGNETQLRLLHQLADEYLVEITIILDIMHVLEYLWKAGHAFCREGTPELEEWVYERALRILQGQASQVAAGMRRSATRRRLSTKKRKPVDACANYLLKYRDYLAYDRYLAAGMPIATGVIEGACRHLVKDRMDLTGARWRLASAEAVLRLRALRSSNDFDAYWRFHEAQEYERNHPPRYAEGEVPAIGRPAPALKLIR
jgi:hypothetical protein